MLEPIIIEATSDTPRVELDKNRGVFRFEGKSLPEDVIKFFSPVQNWFVEYYNDPNPDTDIEFNLDYFNSSTARIIVKILIASETLHGKTTNMHVTWYYRENDEVMRDRGIELKSVVNIPFDIVESR
ncbi:MAG: DUF1987 domain-containing protein [Bacteroidales bacterium]|jgi:hypothetical protein|nr:DUF1987 domain-containing protein [Bacteroidales bacterium]MBQ5575871.1 DUF1987 domain-containing protein [Bacteroidales bacterium]